MRKMKQAMPAIPVISAGENMPDGPCYMLARDGYYLHKCNRLFDAVVKIASLPDLGEMEESVKWTAPKIPSKLLDESLEFFRAVHAKHGGEALVLLVLEKDAWGISAPEQTVSAASVKYACPAGANIAGTIHSHCDMGAFFSGTDTNDVAGFDGVHIVLGRIGRKRPDIEAGVYVNGRLFRCDPEEVIDGWSARGDGDIAHPWLERVTCRNEKSGDMLPDIPPFDYLPPVDESGCMCPRCGEEVADIDGRKTVAQCLCCGLCFSIGNSEQKGIPAWTGF